MATEKRLIPPMKTDSTLNELEAYYSAFLNEAKVALEHIRGVKEITMGGPLSTQKDEPIPPVATAELPAEYSIEFTWETKVLFAIRSLVRAFVPQIIDKLMELEPTLDRKKCEAAVPHRASKLYREKKLKIKKVGKKYEYRLA